MLPRLRSIGKSSEAVFAKVKTVQKEDRSEADLPHSETESEPYPAEYIPMIDVWVGKGLKDLPQKQRRTAMRIYHRLRDGLSYQGSYSGVKTSPRNAIRLDTYEQALAFPLPFSLIFFWESK